LSQLDLNLLAVLETVLSERSVVRAARRLHVTPSAISNALARLRHALGDPLVIRSGRGVVPTPRAAALVPTLSRALRDIDRAIHGDAFDPASTTGQFTLAIADAGQIVQVPRLASDFAKAMPRATLRVVGIDTLLSSGGLAGTEVDLALAGLDDGTPGIHVRPLYEERSVLVARREHPLAGASVPRRQLGALRHADVHVAPGRGYRELAATYARLGITRDVALVVPSFGGRRRGRGGHRLRRHAARELRPAVRRGLRRPCADPVCASRLDRGQAGLARAHGARRGDEGVP
jgi:DNA-binding transcriptional LysR family regulator